jgi:uncharacterized SAM-binding protein YcdF (DUF218 family)
MRHIRFDTLDKKPKVYNIAVLSVLAVIAMLIVSRFDGLRMIGPILVATIYIALVIICLVRAFFLQLRYNPYSYNTIYYSGFTVFLLTVLASLLYVIRDYYLLGAEFSEHMIFGMVRETATQFMIISLPFILIFSIALFISNIELIRHERPRLVNLLGMILSVLLIGGEAFMLYINMYASGSRTEVIIHDTFVNIYAAVFLYFESMLIGSIIAALIAARYEPDKDKDAIIVLGCGIRKDGTPTPILRGRLDRALRFAREQKEMTGKELVFVVSGGQGPNEVISEAASMKGYLVEQGVPEERILMEDKSTDTAENMRFSKDVLKAYNPDAKIAFSTTNYHVFRGGLKARRVKMRAQGMGAPTKWYFWPNAFVREFVGLLTEHRVKQLIIFGSMIAFYVIMTIFFYD